MEKNENPVGGHSGKFNLSFSVPPQILDHLKSIRENELFIAVVTDNYLALNVQCAMELGTALLSGRRIGFLIKEGTTIPYKILKVADEVIYYNETNLPAKSDAMYNLLCVNAELSDSGG